MWSNKTDLYIMQVIGSSLQEERLQANITQQELAKRSGVSMTSIKRLEAGESVSLRNFISVMRALRLLGQLKQAFPEKEISPILLRELEGRKRQRASKQKL